MAMLDDKTQAGGKFAEGSFAQEMLAKYGRNTQSQENRREIVNDFVKSLYDALKEIPGMSDVYNWSGKGNKDELEAYANQIAAVVQHRDGLEAGAERMEKLMLGSNVKEFVERNISQTSVQEYVDKHSVSPTPSLK